MPDFLAIVGLYGRTGTHWLQNLLAAAGAVKPEKDDYPFHQVTTTPQAIRPAALPQPTVFRTARVWGIEQLSTWENVRTFITIRHPMEILWGMKTAFKHPAIDCAHDIVKSWLYLGRLELDYMLVDYRAIPQQWEKICDYARLPLILLPTVEPTWVTDKEPSHGRWKELPEAEIFHCHRIMQPVIEWYEEQHQHLTGGTL